MTLQKRVNSKRIFMQTIYMVGEWVGIFPNGKFKRLKNTENFDVNSSSENSSTGYILEVDLEYLDELHKLHHQLDENLQFPMICCQIIVKKLLVNVGYDKNDKYDKNEKEHSNMSANKLFFLKRLFIKTLLLFIRSNQF